MRSEPVSSIDIGVRWLAPCFLGLPWASMRGDVASVRERGVVLRSAVDFDLGVVYVVDAKGSVEVVGEETPVESARECISMGWGKMMVS